ncbi:21174_t:CDS:2 [Cetraspora pellucida]|uniref:21174_t:CDS:1 n=1 Tax=Cetraspora pellucida TaxID=1433469 RepID=A0A9N8ZB64_9GLOM|nr:21174_t:CDS:2 [Cetraspora pellucida]
MYRLNLNYNTVNTKWEIIGISVHGSAQNSSPSDEPLPRTTPDQHPLLLKKPGLVQKNVSIPYLHLNQLLCDIAGAGDAFARNQLKNEQNISVNAETFILPTAEQFLHSLKEAIVAAGLAVSKYGTMESFPYLEVKEKLEYF